MERPDSAKRIWRNRRCEFKKTSSPWRQGQGD